MDAKRLFDLTFSGLGIIFLSPLIFIISFIILCSSGLPIIYRQKRMGKNWIPFVLYKFRTMKFQQNGDELLCVGHKDKRITKVGKILRKYKLDEIPQLLNVFKGEMSLVGPRPELSIFIEHYPEQFKEILTIKPGITDLASIRFKNESSLLNKVEDNVDAFYISRILPEKLSYNREYIKKRGFFYDVGLIFKTIFTIIFD